MLRYSAVISSGAAQYRIQLWLLDENGLPEAGNPIASNIFDVFPGADRAISARQVQGYLTDVTPGGTTTTRSGCAMRCPPTSSTTR